MAKKNSYYYCNIEGLTNEGCRRPVNEDSMDWFECQNGLVAVVCDGMGGHVGGKVASTVAIETIRAFLSTNYFENPKDAIVAAINAGNVGILNRAAQQPELTGMGSTCVMLIVRDGKVYVGSVGDSRIYLIRSKRIKQLTKDQSYVQMLVDKGEITQEQAERHPRKNEITNALGLVNMQPATVLDESFDPEAGDCFLLCSDGLSGMVSDHDICKIASNQVGMSQKERVVKLVDLARRNGGLDNITCEIVEFSVTPNAVKSEGFIKKSKKIGIAIIALLLVLIGGVVAYFLLGKSPRPCPHPVDENVIKYDAPITFIPDAQFMEIVPDKDRLKTMLYISVDAEQKDTLEVDFLVSIDSIDYQPREHLVKMCLPEKVILSFGPNNFPDSEEIRIELMNKDTICVYGFEVVKKVEANDSPDDSNYVGNPTSTSSTGTSGGWNISDISADLRPTNSSQDEEEKNTTEKNGSVIEIEKLIPQNSDKYSLTIKCKEGNPTDILEVFIPSTLEFAQEQIKEEGYETRKYIDEKTCELRIYPTKLFMESGKVTIRIPLTKGGVLKLTLKPKEE